MSNRAPITFFLLDFNAWGPGLDSTIAWKRWIDTPEQYSPADYGDTPAVPFIAPLLRRRCSRLSKLALKAAHDCLGEQTPIPTVFASPHGEIHRTKSLLDDLAENNPLSPMGFSLSVHNTAGGIYSINTKSTAPSHSIAAGADTFVMSLYEALGHLIESRDASMLVIYADEPLPAFFAGPTEDSVPFPYSLALHLSLNRPENPIAQLALSRAEQQDEGSEPTQALALIKLLYGAKSSITVQGENNCWRIKKVQ